MKHILELLLDDIRHFEGQPKAQEIFRTQYQRYLDQLTSEREKAYYRRRYEEEHQRDDDATGYK